MFNRTTDEPDLRQTEIAIKLLYVHDGKLYTKFIGTEQKAFTGKLYPI